MIRGMPQAKDILHYTGCNPNYPEKPEGEKPRTIQRVALGDGYIALVCSDCGASVTNLPPPDDPYWEDNTDER